MAIDFEATKQNMRIINKRAFMREMALQHPNDPPVSHEMLVMLLSGTYPTDKPKGLQVIGYLREYGYLVERPDAVDLAA